MTDITDRGFLFIIGCRFLLHYSTGNRSVITLLLALTAAAFCYYVRKKRSKTIWIAGYFLACLFLPELCFFLPVLFYDCARERFYWGIVGLLPFFLYSCPSSARSMIFPFSATAVSFLVNAGETELFLLSSAISVLLALRTQRAQCAEAELIRMRDASTEIQLILKEKNRTLQANQDYEIHVATLKERNRIAREIHDNVGHMLSRCILQMAALMTIYKKDTIHEQLLEINTTLNHAMTSIRESVHDLHDESIDMQQVLTEILSPMQDLYHINVQYDMSARIPSEIKFCLINIVKEAMSNVVKHSNATKIEVILREQPGFYQLSIDDNGTISRNSSTDGIGLINMQDRVEKLDGFFRVSDPSDGYSQAGFHIFVSIPKKHIDKPEVKNERI